MTERRHTEHDPGRPAHGIDCEQVVVDVGIGPGDGSDRAGADDSGPLSPASGVTGQELGRGVRSAVHRTILVVDVEGFGNRRRTTPHQLAIREGLYRTLRQAFDAVGMSWEDCHHEDRGDGVFLLAPAHIPKAQFVQSLPGALVVALREHNAAHRSEEQIRLRLALHAGEVAFDQHGVTAASINLAFRLLDASAVKQALADSSGVLAMVVSEWFFDEVVQHSTGVDPTTFRPVRIAVKETSTVGWVCLPDHPYPADPAALTIPPTDPARPVPRQLPAPPRHFTGRLRELDGLTAMLEEPGGTVVVSAIAGAGGIGKTWLALHWAHQNLDRFPDGHLFVNLNGYAPTGQPLTPARAVRSFLDALGVAAGSIPVDLDAQTALYRSLVAGRRMLIVLDNARTADQIIPLLPGTPTCTVLITSRSRLTRLINTHSAHPLPVDVLSDQEARELLATRLSANRLNAEPDAVNKLLACCAGFPLALSIVAGRAQTHPHLPLTDLAAELHDTTNRLDTLDGDDPAAGLSAVLSWSSTALPTDQARMFALLGIAPGPDISLPAAANLTNLPIPQTRALLHSLDQAHLVHQHLPGRYRMHDLIKLYATNQAHHLPDTERTQALQRLVNYYLHTAHTADQLLDPHRPPIQLDPPGPDCHPHPLPDQAAALAWLDTEHPGLLATQHLTTDQGWHHTVWHLAWTLDTFHHRRGHRHDLLTVWQAGLAAAHHDGNPTILTLAHRRLGHACAHVGRHTDALGHLNQALTLAQDTGDLPAQAHTHHALAWAWEQQGNDQHALEHATTALHLYQTLHQPVPEADTLNAVGWYSARLGHYEQARTHLQAALTLSRRHHDPTVEAATLDSLGYLAHHTSHHDQALDHYQHALTLRRDLGNTHEEADTLDHLGHTHATLGNHDQARHTWQHAQRLYQTQHRTTDAERIQQQLDALNSEPDHAGTPSEPHQQ